MARREFHSEKLFETGIYTITDVANLTGIPAINISRWVKGYSYRRGKAKRHQRPVWTPELPRQADYIPLSFNDLLEIRFIHAFRKRGVPLPKIRAAIRKLRRLIGARYPFSRQMIFTDGKELFTKVLDRTGKPILFELTTDLYAFYEIILPSLKTGIDFENGEAARWFPDRKTYKDIVVDPRVAFGRPTIVGTRMDIKILADAYEAEQSYERVANWYEVETDAVKQAVSFHMQRKAA